MADSLERQQVLISAVVIWGHSELRRMVDVCTTISSDFEEYSRFIDRTGVEIDEIRRYTGSLSSDNSRMAACDGHAISVSDMCWRIIAGCGQAKAWLEEADAVIRNFASLLSELPHCREIDGVKYRVTLLKDDSWHLISCDGRKQTLPFQAFGAFSETDSVPV